MFYKYTEVHSVNIVGPFGLGSCYVYQNVMLMDYEWHKSCALQHRLLVEKLKMCFKLFHVALADVILSTVHKYLLPAPT